MVWLLPALLFVVVPVQESAPASRVAPAEARPGRRADGSILLPNGWALAPHGQHVELPADLPVRLAWHPGGSLIAVQHVGFRAHQVAIVDGVTLAVVATCKVPRSWSGMAWTPQGDRLLVSGGVDDVVHELRWDGDARRLTAGRRHVVGSKDRLDMPAGLCVDGRGRAFVVLQRSHEVVRLDLDGGAPVTFALPADSYPFECALTPDGHTLLVSLWNRGEVVALDAESGASRFALATGQHPSELLLDRAGTRLFVSNGNENTVTVVDLATRRVVETLSSALFPQAPPGSTPNSLALSANQSVLLVANADNNDLAVIDVSQPGRARSLGFIPVGCYPTSVRFTPDGTRVFVANGKGHGGSRANPGFVPESRPRQLGDYLGSMFLGSLSVFPFPSPAELQRLATRAYDLAPLTASASVRGLEERPADSPIPARPGDPSPITHVVYILKENRTYDQVFGDDPRGNGDPSICLFPEAVTPNHHALAREFVLLDNFYVESEVSADGHEWSMGAYATDFVERSWPVTYGGKGKPVVEGGRPVDLGYPAEGAFRLAQPKNGYLWDLARAAGVSYRSYGEFVQNGPTASQPGKARVASLDGHFDPLFRSFDMEYPDVKRAGRFLAELAGFEQRGELPRLIVLRLPNDHTAGTKVGAWTPRACVADNDLALGMVLAALSKSRFWPHLAVFVTEDDAQNGPDHVDAHRTVALVAGPYVRRGAVVSAMYSTCSMLRTMELILGLPPMSQFDAAARPMYACFTGRPDLTPYASRPARWPLDERNRKLVHGADLSERFDLAREDAADDLLLNEVIWRSIRGDDQPMPAPRRAAFVRTLGDD